MTSKGFQLDKNDIQKFLRNMAILYGPVALLFIDQVQSGALDVKVLYALLVSLTFDLVRRVVTDYTKQT